ncbi:unnamed protein product [Didymodactylos carnosus]|uniref:Rnh202 triple barrel domain-containing protein n=1 Tax=Didymodactylos carnosus TaxID=1234261 RepID=A0A813SYQ1_9BILA|nr:unnamed protein product [Didymodactylos carnosus]CAF0838927.1 unnamed protein product [Didymodactylos carnosus]CAF3587395.1 unnamed protein product [Didymodactylos carnosus]CAF3623840.1 unnamed protein product [Didymodactylos carnosus]
MTQQYVLVVDKQLLYDTPLEFIRFHHPRSNLIQSFAIDKKNKIIFELIKYEQKYSSWFVNDKMVINNGTLYMTTPVNILFLMLPALWNTRIQYMSIVNILKMNDENFGDFYLNFFTIDFISEKISIICDMNEKQEFQLNEQKLMKWLEERHQRLMTKGDLNNAQAFDIICEYLNDDCVEQLQQYLKLKENSFVHYEIPTGQKNQPKATELKKATTIDICTTRNITTIKQKSDCIFAKRSHICAAPTWAQNESIEQYCERLLPTFMIFCAFVREVSFDGYVVEIPHNELTRTIEDFAQVFKKILKCLSDNDPAKRYCMNSTKIDSRGWVFEFDRITFFITTFSPHYPNNHPRYAHESKNYCHILFQPELSFLRHNLSDDTPLTNWENPTTDRDKIRVSFQNHERSYPIRDTIHYPAAHDMIRPLSNDVENIVQWWL